MNCLKGLYLGTIVYLPDLIQETADDYRDEFPICVEFDVHQDCDLGVDRSPKWDEVEIQKVTSNDPALINIGDHLTDLMWERIEEQCLDYYRSNCGR